MNLIRVFEHECLSVNENTDNGIFKQHHLERLLEFNDRNKNIYFTPVRKGVKFRNYVGVIQIGGLTIEILPKTDKDGQNDKKAYDKWQKVLLDMLAVCRYINVNSVSETFLNRKHNSILDIYFEIFLDEVLMLMRKGLIRKYRRQTGNVLTLKGKLHFGKNIQQNLIHAERFYTDHQVYDYEHLLNNVLYKALLLLKKMPISIHLRDRLQRIFLDFPELQETSICESDFGKLKETRKTLVYRKALQIARMIILNYSPDIRGGKEHMIALLFDMNKLWEFFIYRMLKKYENPNLNIEYSKTKKFWENKLIKPDIIMRYKHRHGEDISVLDVKWKAPENNEPSDSDLKQMFAYNIYWESYKGFLLYPQTSNIEDKSGVFHKGLGGISTCTMTYVNILNNQGRLNMDIGREILEKCGVY